jgi:hypothetical protein
MRARCPEGSAEFEGLLEIGDLGEEATEPPAMSPLASVRNRIVAAHAASLPNAGNFFHRIRSASSS